MKNRQLSAEPVLLVTGFGPFQGYTDNPSGVIAEEADGRRVAGTRLVGRKIEVSWRGAWQTVAAAVDEVAPVGLLCLGVCPDAFFRLELMAKNLATPMADVLAEQPPTDGRMRLVPEAPPAYWTELPVEWLAERMEKRRTRLAAREPYKHFAHAYLWPDAGFYLCNQVFFHAMHQLTGRVPHRGFVHVPRGNELDAGYGVPSREEVLEAGAYLVGEFARWLSRTYKDGS
jgi:pyroglutamyl-peptidase